jgi:hypothetical protein
LRSFWMKGLFYGSSYSYIGFLDIWLIWSHGSRLLQ